MRQSEELQTLGTPGPEIGAQSGQKRARKGPERSLRRAIDRFCKGCIYDPGSGCGTWRQQVEGCPARDCPLYAVRPRSSARERSTWNVRPGRSGSA